MKAWEIIERYGWRQKKYGNTRTGFCILGALHRAYPDNASYQSVKIRIQQTLDKGIPDWNDAPSRTKAQVVGLLKRLE